jgi:hypothetical protein
MSHIRIFGCKILVRNQKVERSKLNLQAFEGTFVRCDENSMTYKCYNLKKKKTMFNKDVKFNEFSTIKHEAQQIDLLTKLFKMNHLEEVLPNGGEDHHFSEGESIFPSVDVLDKTLKKEQSNCQKEINPKIK